MSVRLQGGVVRLEGACPIEDAEPLTALLQADGRRPVDLSACHAMHAAIAQALIAFAPPLIGQPLDEAAAKLLAARK